MELNFKCFLCLIFFLICVHDSITYSWEGQPCFENTTRRDGICKLDWDKCKAYGPYREKNIFFSECSVYPEPPLFCCPLEESDIQKLRNAENPRNLVGKPCVENHEAAPGICRPLSTCRIADVIYKANYKSLELCSTFSDDPIVCCPDEAVLKKILLYRQYVIENDIKEVWPRTKTFALVQNAAGGGNGGKSIGNKPGAEFCFENQLKSYGSCKPVQECASALDIYFRRGVSLNPCSYDNRGNPTVCCPGDETPTLNGPTGGNTQVASFKDPPFLYGVTILSPYPVDQWPFNPYQQYNHSDVGSIEGGKPTAIGEYPFMAAIGWPKAKGKGYFWKCGGTLINPRLVLTAGHCVFAEDPESSSTTPTVVRLGDHNLNEDVLEGDTPLTLGIERIIKHPLYKPPQKYNDLALLKLDAFVPLTKHIDFACLWDENKPIGDIGANLTAAGWGYEHPGARKGSDELLQVNLTLFKPSDCEKNIEYSRNWKKFDEQTQLCAGDANGGHDTCQGDSGGPLFYKDSREGSSCHFYVVGVTSFGGTCGVAKGSGIYTNVAKYRDWIYEEADKAAKMPDAADALVSKAGVQGAESGEPGNDDRPKPVCGKRMLWNGKSWLQSELCQYSNSSASELTLKSKEVQYL